MGDFLARPVVSLWSACQYADRYGRVRYPHRNRRSVTDHCQRRRVFGWNCQQLCFEPQLDILGRARICAVGANNLSIFVVWALAPVAGPLPAKLSRSLSPLRSAKRSCIPPNMRRIPTRRVGHQRDLLHRVGRAQGRQESHN